MFDLQKKNQTDEEFVKQAYALHNTLRAKHNAPALEVNPDAEKHAKQWCQKLADEDHMHHSSASGFGENLFYSSKVTEGMSE